MYLSDCQISEIQYTTEKKRCKQSKGDNKRKRIPTKEFSTNEQTQNSYYRTTMFNIQLKMKKCQESETL